MGDQWWTPPEPHHEEQAWQGGVEKEVGDDAQEVQGQQVGGLDEGSGGGEEGVGHHGVGAIEWQNGARPNFVCQSKGELHSLSLHVHVQLFHCNQGLILMAATGIMATPCHTHHHHHIGLRVAGSMLCGPRATRLLSCEERWAHKRECAHSHAYVLTKWYRG